jgi:hypothetical protein
MMNAQESGGPGVIQQAGKCAPGDNFRLRERRPEDYGAPSATMNLRRLHWSLYFLLVVLTMLVLGASLGALAFMLFGALTGAAFSTAELARTGAETLGFYALMWAPGLALVLTVKRAYEQRRFNEKS